MAVIDANRISVTADTNYTGLIVKVEAEIEVTSPWVFLGENTVRLLTGLKNVPISYSLVGGNSSWVTCLPPMWRVSIRAMNTMELPACHSCWVIRIRILPGMRPIRLAYHQSGFQ